MALKFSVKTEKNANNCSAKEGHRNPEVSVSIYMALFFNKLTSKYMKLKTLLLCVKQTIKNWQYLIYFCILPAKKKLYSL